MNIAERLKIGLLITSSALLATASGCMTYTVFSHPDVEVYDERIGKYLHAEVELVSDCKSCHDNHASKYALYANGVNARRMDKTSLDKINLLKAREDEPDLRGLNNYLNSEFGYYYYAPWWFDGVAVGSGVIGRPAPLPIAPNAAQPTSGIGTPPRQISRRASAESSSGTSGAQSGSRTSSETKTGSASEPSGRQSSSEPKEEKRGSGRVR
jgi:hypothetical protein